MDGRPDAGIVVPQSAVNVHALWGTLSVAAVLVLWRGHQGAETVAGRLTIDIVAGAFLVASLAAWFWFLRRPARLVVTPDRITFAHGDRAGVELPRTGDLYIHRTMVGTKGGTVAYLKVAGSDAAIPLQLFSWKKIEGACRAAGWTFADRPS